MTEFLQTKNFPPLKKTHKCVRIGCSKCPVVIIFYCQNFYTFFANPLSDIGGLKKKKPGKREMMELTIWTPPPTSNEICEYVRVTLEKKKRSKTHQLFPSCDTVRPCLSVHGAHGNETLFGIHEMKKGASNSNNKKKV